MAANTRLSNLRGAGRRDFIKWSATVGAVLGLERARFLDVIFDQAGGAMADTAACAATAKSIHIVGDNGGLAWFTQLFAYPTIAKTGNNGTVAMYTDAGSVKAAQTDAPSVYTPCSPFQSLGPKKQMSVFIAGTNEAHTTAPNSALALGNNNLLAAITAIQAATPTLLPVMAVNPFPYGSAPGAAAPAVVGSSEDLVGLFNSAASQTLLQSQTTANLHEAYYKAFLNLNAAAARPQVQAAYNTGHVAANLLGKNLSSQLSVTAADSTRYGVTASTPSTIVEIANALCTAVKAFRLGLTSCLIIPAMQDDPHGAFTDMALLQSNVTTLGQILDAFMADCALAPDPAGCSSQTLADSVVITISGDTPKDATTQAAWPDSPVGDHNLLMVMGNGWLKTGFFGDVDPAGNLTTWDPNTGNLTSGANAMTSQQLAVPAAAAAAYAVAKGDARIVENNFGVNVPPGVTIANNM